MKRYDYLIVGSGLFGATFAFRAKEKGKKCLVIEKRSHLGGNVYCENVNGINVHKYGAHIFHTSDKDIWTFVNRFVTFNRYTNCPVAIAGNDKLYNLPFNMNTFYQLWGVKTPAEAMRKLEEQRLEVVKLMREEGVSQPRNLEEQALLLIGRDIYETLIRDYTEKQWGCSCKDLDPSIIKRLPVRLTFDNNYFNDPYQGIPIGGYNRLIEALLDGTECLTDTDFFHSKYKDWQQFSDKLVYTGPLDQYFDYRLGRLDWRTVRFETRVEEIPNFQGNAVVNYTSHKQPYTRIIEHKHFEMFGDDLYKVPHTVVSEEYSDTYREGMEPFYPVGNAVNNELAASYRQLASEEKDVIFGGRLAQYRYFDMDKVIAEAMKIEF